MEDKTLEDMRLIIGVLNSYQGFKESSTSLSDIDFILIGLQVEFKEYKPYQSLCRAGEQATEAYYVLVGKIAVTNRVSKYYDEALLEGAIFHFERGGSSLGEEGVTYGTNR